MCGCALKLSLAATPAEEMKQVRPLGNPELHVVIGPSSQTQLAVPCRIVSVQILTDEVALLGENRAVRLVLQLALVRSDTGRLSKQKAVVSGNDDMMAVQIIDNVPDQRRQFVDCRPERDSL